MLFKIWKKDTTTKMSDQNWIKIIDYKVKETKWPLYSISWDEFYDLIAVCGGDSILRFKFKQKNLSIFF